jgi:hypothetical protein
MSIQAEMIRGCNPNADPYEVAEVFALECEAEAPDFRRILRVYAAGNPDVRNTINDTLISLCGWSLHSLIRKAELLKGEDGGEIISRCIVHDYDETATDECDDPSHAPEGTA